MLVSLNNSPKTSFQNHPNYRVVQVSNRQGRVGMLVPHANLVVPDKQAIRSLSEIIKLYEKLPERKREYGFSNGYCKYPEQRATPLASIDLNRTDDLPLFAKQ
jgi:hypothetical protein